MLWLLISRRQTMVVIHMLTRALLNTYKHGSLWCRSSFHCHVWSVRKTMFLFVPPDIKSVRGVVHGHPQKFFQGGATLTFCLSFSGCYRCNVQKLLNLFYTTKEMPHFATTVTKMRFVGSYSQVYYDYYHNRPSADFQNRVLLFPEVQYCHGLLPSKCQRHLETRAANVWDLVQSDQSPFAFEQNLACL